MALARLIDVALACGLTELRPRPMTIGDWTNTLDGEGEFSGLEETEREALIREGAAWPDRRPAVEAWSEGTVLYREALNQAGASNGTEEAFWSRMEGRREHWALTMWRAAYVLKNAGNGDWWCFGATALAPLDGRTPETIPIMDRINVETLAAFAQEAFGWLSEDDNGTAKLARLIAAAAWPEDGDALAPSIWLDEYLAAGVLEPSGTELAALYMAADGTAARRSVISFWRASSSRSRSEHAEHVPVWPGRCMCRPSSFRVQLTGEPAARQFKGITICEMVFERSKFVWL